jgi:hypothetical protein
MITYTEQFTASGTLGTKTFTDAMLTITGIADTANITNPIPGLFDNATTTATVDIVGTGMATITSSIHAFDFQGGIRNDAGFNLGGGAVIVDTKNSVFATYDLKSSIGPESGPVFLSLPAGFSLSTDQGTLSFTSFGSNSTFTATTATPEPASLTLLGLGVASIAGYAWRRRR